MNTILAVRPLMILVRPCTRAMWVLLACLSAGPAARAAGEAPPADTAPEREEKIEGAIGLILTHKPT
jgi:hypothetical protein